MRKNVLVVGMARSGTSLTASIFVKNGYFVAEDPGNQLQAADQTNPSGFWESEYIKEANVKILEAVDFRHHNTWTFEEIRPDQAEAIFSLKRLEEHTQLLQKYENRRPWIWKDPRLCYTLAYWWPMMNPDNTSVLLVTRDPNEIWRSFLRRGWGGARSGEKSEFICKIEDHIGFARKTINRFDIPHMEIDYSDYARQPKIAAERLSRYFGCELTAKDLGYQSKYNSSALRGYVGYLAERIAAVLPAPVRRMLKRAMPDFIMRIVFPTKSTR